jgi:hypothetical protein
MSTLPQQQRGLHRWHAWQDRIRDASLSVILALEAVIIFFSAPLEAKGLPLAEEVVNVLTWTMVAIIVLLSRRRGAIISIVAGLTLIVADLSAGAAWSPAVTAAFSGGGSALGFAALTWVVARAVFAPGGVTAQRLQGAIVIYLNLALIFASAYRLIAALDPAAFSNTRGEFGSLLYFSLVTLTTTGYGDITPVDPFARGVASLEAVIGQFYLAITIARLVALQVADQVRRMPKGQAEQTQTSTPTYRPPSA